MARGKAQAFIDQQAKNKAAEVKAAPNLLRDTLNALRNKHQKHYTEEKLQKMEWYIKKTYQEHNDWFCKEGIHGVLQNAIMWGETDYDFYHQQKVEVLPIAEIENKNPIEHHILKAPEDYDWFEDVGEGAL